MKLFRFREVSRGSANLKFAGTIRDKYREKKQTIFLCGETVAMKDLSGEGHRAKPRIDKVPTRRSARLKVTEEKEET